MLSRAALPLTRPNVLASAFRVSLALSAQRPRWYAQGKGSTPYNLPESMQSEESKTKKRKATKNTQPEQHSTEQPEFDTKAQPKTDAEASQPVSYRHLSTLQFIKLNWTSISNPFFLFLSIVRSRRIPLEATP